MNTQIYTLAQLQAEKQQLKMQLEISKKEFFRSFGDTKTQAKDFLVKKVALPVGALGLATLGIKQVIGNQDNNSDKERGNGIFLRLLPLAIPMIQNYLVNQKNEYE